MVHIQRVPQFRVFQALFWSAYSVVLFIDVLPRSHMRAALIYDAVFLVSLFSSSLVLRKTCESGWAGKAVWPQAMLRAGVVAVSLGIPCGLLAEWCWTLARSWQVGWSLLLDAWQGTAYGVFVLIAWSALYLGIKHNEAFQSERERALRAETLAREARLEALRCQLNPHFLFNTLNAISTLILEGNSHSANQMLVQLSAFLRQTLNGAGTQLIPFQQEITHTEQYLEIEKARLGERLNLEFSIAAEVLPVRVPALLLQPLVENAVRHGIAPRPNGGTLTIKAERAGSRVRILVADNGIGCSSFEAAAKPQSRGLGLSNTVERLRVLYGSDHFFKVSWQAEGGCQVEIEMPAIGGPESLLVTSMQEKESSCVS